MALRADWCTEHAPADADCAAHFAEHDALFRVAWAEERRTPATISAGWTSPAATCARHRPEHALVGADLPAPAWTMPTCGGRAWRRVSLDHAELAGAVLREAQLEDATLIGIEPQGADLREAWLAGAICRTSAPARRPERGGAGGRLPLDARIDGADLGGARFEGSDLTVAGSKGRPAHRALRRRRTARRADDGADLRWADLRSTPARRRIVAASPAHFADFRGTPT